MDTGEAVFVQVTAYSGPPQLRIETFKGIDEPLVYRKGRELRQPKRLPKKKEGRPPEKRENSICVDILGSHVTLESAVTEFPFLDDIITGIAKLDYSGTRGLLPNKLFMLLSTLPEITSKATQEATWCSERHARNYASALRICADAFERDYGKTLTDVCPCTEFEELTTAA